eukprot:CAMPEP_0114556658 /NCGR_PEP_ID=MMETSP0114-20121206/9407_1 /TAXON_ID=31324 /ORGANISM="Goniomonas sp, Strain m" /LENGTH=531 /DNA_ID=CAMNT_0001741879 /DNA_START=109 /DNA_END=1704 /DNA_ORIENTATION=+
MSIAQQVPYTERSVNSVGSAGSRGSQGGKYRTLSRNSNVDESLFGTKPKSKSGRLRNLGGDAAIVSRDEINAMLSRRPANVETDSLVITASELERLKHKATVNPLEERMRQKQMAEEERGRQQAAARERKKKMIQMEEIRKKNQPKSDLEMEAAAAGQGLLATAQQARDERLDDVKHMNQMMLYSKCVTIRDAQLMEKHIIAKERAEEERRLDQQMEDERVRALRLYDEREREKEEERRQGAAIIRQQIQEREQQRIREQELLDQEREAMLRQIQLLKDEDHRKEEARREAGRRLLEEAAAANTEQIKRKELMKLQLAEEEERIHEYIKEKEKRDWERQMELERVAKQKADEVARLRALQEKAQDKQAEQDALRARRAQEDYEREWRAKERREIERKQRMLNDIMESRVQQKSEKERRVAEAAQLEQEEFYRILDVQRQAEHTERTKESHDRERRLKHKGQILQQITDIEEKRRKERQEFLEEGNKLRHDRDLERRRLEAIKARKLQELHKAGVPDKYTIELAGKKIDSKW